MYKTFDQKQIVSKVHPFGDGVFEGKHLFIFRKNRFFKVVKPRECISNDIVFAKDEMNIRVELFNVIEPANDTVRSGVVSGNVEMIGMEVWHGAK